MEKIHINIDKQLKHRLNVVIAQKDTNITLVVISLIEKYIQKNEKQ